MDISRFGTNSPGRLIEISGPPNVTHAFIPSEFPTNWVIPYDMWPLVVEARAAIAALDGIGRHLPNPQILLRPIQHREAQLSSRLEGTITQPEQQLLFDIEAEISDENSANLDALREVRNYRRALDFRAEVRGDLPFSLRLIRELHRILLTGVRGADREPGHFRRVQVQIGQPARFVPPPPHLVMPLLDNLEKYLHKPNRLDPLVDAFLVHYQFEAIHPFRDGNGRVGRLLLSMMISERCGLSHNWLYMSAYYDEHRDRYLSRLFEVSASGAWNEWITFCLEGVISQAHDTELRCDHLVALSSDFKTRIASIGGSHRLNGIADGLFESPLVTIPFLADRYSVTYPTAKSDVERLVEMGILSELAQARPKSYYSKEIFDLIYSDLAR